MIAAAAAILWGGCGLFTLAYFTFFTQLTNRWGLLLRQPKPDSPSRYPFVSVLVPVRNEAAYLADCLAGLLGQSYPTGRYEIIVVDDHSTDNTARIIESYASDRLLQVSLSKHSSALAGKKAALAHGVQQARGSLIVTTDGDCRHPREWLSTLVAYHLHHPEALLTASVLPEPSSRFLDRFQALDLIGYMVLTGGMANWGRPILANGANMAFPRSLYDRLGGYEAHLHRSSGDDVFFLESARRSGTPVVFIPGRSATVTTFPELSWRAFLLQRLRWAGKSDSYTQWELPVLQGGIFCFCWTILLSPFFFFPQGIFVGLAAWLLKSMVDFRLLYAGCAHYGHRRWMQSFWASQLVHPLYLILVGTTTLFRPPVRWRGRRVQ